MASVLGVADLPVANAKKKRKKRCRKLKQHCQTGNKNKKCCKNLTCDVMPGLAGTHCCRGFQGPCGDDSDCCQGFACSEPTSQCLSIF